MIGLYALTWRELSLIGRTRAFWAAAGAYVVLLFMFVLVWGDGLPLANARSNWQQFNTAQSAVLSVLLPWTAARCGALRRRDLVMLSVATATAPSVLLLARWIATSCALFALGLTALPATLLVQQIGSAPLTSIGSSMATCAGLAAFAAAITTGCVVVCKQPLNGWVAATTITVATGAAMPLPIPTAAVWLLIAAGATIALSTFADYRLLHLAEETLP